MPARKPYRPVLTGVSFHPDVLDYLDRLKVEEDLDRSALLNRIVRDHALRRANGADRLPLVVRKVRVAGIKPVY